MKLKHLIFTILIHQSNAAYNIMKDCGAVPKTKTGQNITEMFHN
jgi:hypothetical protein